MTIQSSGVLVDKTLSERFPESEFHLFKEQEPNGDIKMTLVVRTKTHMTTHVSEAILVDFEKWDEENIRLALLANMREV